MENNQNKKVENEIKINFEISKTVKKPKKYSFKKLNKADNKNKIEEEKIEKENILKDNLNLKNNIKNKKLMKNFKDCCFKIILTNHLKGNH